MRADFAASLGRVCLFIVLWQLQLPAAADPNRIEFPSGEVLTSESIITGAPGRQEVEWRYYIQEPGARRRQLLSRHVSVVPGRVLPDYSLAALQPIRLVRDGNDACLIMGGNTWTRWGSRPQPPGGSLWDEGGPIWESTDPLGGAVQNFLRHFDPGLPAGRHTLNGLFTGFVSRESKRGFVGFGFGGAPYRVSSVDLRERVMRVEYTEREPHWPKVIVLSAPQYEWRFDLERTVAANPGRRYFAWPNHLVVDARLMVSQRDITGSTPEEALRDGAWVVQSALAPLKAGQWVTIAGGGAPGDPKAGLLAEVAGGFGDPDPRRVTFYERQSDEFAPTQRLVMLGEWMKLARSLTRAAGRPGGDLLVRVLFVRIVTSRAQ